MLDKMTPLSEIIKYLNKSSEFKQCTAIEINGNLCFNKIVSKGLCDKHYYRLRVNGNINLIKKEKKCKFIDCDLKYRAKGYCEKHYKQFVHSKVLCSVKNCSRPITSKLMCKMHYQRMQKYGSPEGKSAYIPNVNKNIEIGNIKRYCPPRKNFRCIVPNCLHTYESSKIKKGLCRNHYYKWHKYGRYE